MSYGGACAKTTYRISVRLYGKIDMRLYGRIGERLYNGIKVGKQVGT